MNRLLPKNKRYSKLIADLKRILEQGKKAALDITSQIVVQAYWEMGKRITEDKIGISSISKLSQDLNVERTLLSRIVKFYQTWPKVCPAGHTGHTLSWGHFKELLVLEDKKSDNGIEVFLIFK